MSTIFGALNINDTDRVFNATAGQRAIYDLALQYVEKHNEEMARMEMVFVDRETTDYKLRYKLPGNGRMQRTGNQSAPGAVKAYGGYDVAFPLENFAAQVAGNDVDLAYMTALEFQRHIDSVRIADRNSRRFELLKAILNNTQRTFTDPLWGSLLVEPLANGDTVTYPPVAGSESEGTDDHYLESGYASSAISDTNDPYVTLGQELEEHFGLTPGYSNIAFLINPAQVAKTAALAAFTDAPVNGLIYGADVSLTSQAPMLPGRVIGRHTYGWVSEWSWMPANYILAVHLDAPKPLYKRVDPADTGLGIGLQLVAIDQEFPFKQWYWRNRYGFGVGNRLSAAVMELGTGGTYTIPTAYA